MKRLSGLKFLCSVLQKYEFHFTSILYISSTRSYLYETFANEGHWATCPLSTIKFNLTAMQIDKSDTVIGRDCYLIIRGVSLWFVSNCFLRHNKHKPSNPVLPNETDVMHSKPTLSRKQECLWKPDFVASSHKKFES